MSTSCFAILLTNATAADIRSSGRREGSAERQIQTVFTCAGVCYDASVRRFSAGGGGAALQHHPWRGRRSQEAPSPRSPPSRSPSRSPSRPPSRSRPLSRSRSLSQALRSRQRFRLGPPSPAQALVALASAARSTCTAWPYGRLGRVCAGRSAMDRGGWRPGAGRPLRYVNSASQSYSRDRNVQIPYFIDQSANIGFLVWTSDFLLLMVWETGMCCSFDCPSVWHVRALHECFNSIIQPYQASHFPLLLLCRLLWHCSKKTHVNFSWNK